MTLAKGHMSIAFRQRGKKLYIFGPGHMTKMAAMPIYAKNLKKKKLKKIFFYGTTGLIVLKLGM